MNRNQYIRHLSAAFMLGSFLAVAPTVPAAEPLHSPKQAGGSLVDTLKNLEDQMSKIFRDTLNQKNGKDAIYSASVDVREQPDHYTVRLHLPDRDLNRVQVQLEGRALKITGEKGYEQSLVLRHATADAKLDITRKEHTLVVTVPKDATGSTADTKPSTPAPNLLAPNSSEKDVLDRMRKMEREMNEAFQDAFKDFSITPGLFDRPEFGSSIDLQDDSGQYVVRAYLPGRDTKNIDVKLEGQTLNISAKAETRERKEEKNGTAESFSLSSYAQVLTLPGPVEEHKMKIDRKEGLLVITIPKKNIL